MQHRQVYLLSRQQAGKLQSHPKWASAPQKAPALHLIPPLHGYSQTLCPCSTQHRAGSSICAWAKSSKTHFEKQLVLKIQHPSELQESPQLKQAERLLLLSSCCQRQHLPLALPPLGSLPWLPLRKAPGGRGFVSLFLPNRFALLSHVITVPRRPPPPVGISGHVRKRLRSATTTFERLQSPADAENTPSLRFMNEQTRVLSINVKINYLWAFPSHRRSFSWRHQPEFLCPAELGGYQRRRQ